MRTRRRRQVWRSRSPHVLAEWFALAVAPSERSAHGVLASEEVQSRFPLWRLTRCAQIPSIAITVGAVDVIETAEEGNVSVVRDGSATTFAIKGLRCNPLVVPDHLVCFHPTSTLGWQEAGHDRRPGRGCV